MYEIAPGSTSQSIQFYLRDSVTGQAKTGLLYNSSGARGGYARQGGSAVSFALASLSSPTASYVSGGFVEMDAVATPGLYRLDPPDATLAAGAAYATATLNFDGALGDAALIMLRSTASAVGPGGYTFGVTVQTSGAAPISGASVWVSTDSSGTNVIAGALTTGAPGTVSFLLSAGTYYLWVNAQGYEASNPTTFTVAASGTLTLTLAASTAPPSLSAGSGDHQARTTSHDLSERLLDFLGADRDERNYRGVRRAILDAARSHATAHHWTELRQFGRIALVGQYATGTVQFQLTAGTYLRQLTLTDGVWPTWAAKGYVRVGSVVAKADARVSDTILTLKDPCFAADIDAGTAYAVCRDAYTLPADFVASDNAMAETCWGGLSYVPYRQWLATTRGSSGAGTPVVWTIAGDPDLPGRLAMVVAPAPDADGTLDFMYYRRPRDITTFDLSDGTATVAGGSPSTVTLSSPLLTSSMQGSVIRLSAAAGDAPTGRDGLTPYYHEANIVSVVSTTVAVMDQAAPAGLDAVAYRISDPVDAEDLLQVLFARTAQKHLAVEKSMKQLPSLVSAWEGALILAKEADSRVAASRAEGVTRGGRRRLADMPIRF